ncbi:MAG: hypothetical protein KJ620_04730 [Candidatus Edwardsbacteria bacterium]|nr:hypothetical protein [Candidatus Edwardsbacteria bacterium]MBU1577227.1 hypothetical protein [Candidatus Edwardsbacteria bacterium]MBU2462477.1 hypothetical protein [Candidatus Edwardsbacteria bacterium]MBU2594076.1 hypothetical protein [Candidatus Edwardsbacteria bacterium]
MKTLKLFLALSATFLLVISFGCSKDDPAAPPPATNTAVTQQTYAADAGKDMAATCDDGISDFSGYLSGFSKGKTSKNFYDSTYWWGPYDGWYYLYWNTVGIIHPDSSSSDTSNYSWLYKIRFYPNTVAPDSVEWYWTYSDTTTAYYSYHGKVGYDGDNLHVKGFWNFGIYTPASYDYTWDFTFDSVSIATNDYQGHYTFVCNYWPYYTGTGYELGKLSGDYRFNANGSGTGSLSLNDIEVVRYVFYDIAADTRGYYTLAAESWGTQHSFGSKK